MQPLASRSRVNDGRNPEPVRHAADSRSPARIVVPSRNGRTWGSVVSVGRRSRACDSVVLAERRLLRRSSPRIHRPPQRCRRPRRRPCLWGMTTTAAGDRPWSGSAGAGRSQTESPGHLDCTGHRRGRGRGRECERNSLPHCSSVILSVQHSFCRPVTLGDETIEQYATPEAAADAFVRKVADAINQQDSSILASGLRRTRPTQC